MPNVKQLIREYELHTSKRLDQHFLIDENVLTREADYAKLTKDDKVLEIGPGPGTLTKILKERAGSVTVIEKDPQFLPILEKLGVEIIIGDAMKVDFPECNKIVSNLPYSISSPITFKILDHPIDLAVLCYQKEFAQRMVAKPGTADYSRLSVNCSVRADVELLENVPKDRYYPEPKVDSTVVRLTPKHVDLPPKFDDITRALFQHKNKKVRNALIDSAHEISQDKEKVKEWADSLWEIKEKKVISLAPEDIIQLASTF